MTILKYPLSSIIEIDLSGLVSGGVRENRTLDYKRECYGNDDASKAEFLADISALANTLGGDLILGMEEEQGVATSLIGLASDTNIDQEILRLTQIAQSGLQPRIPVLEFHTVSLGNGNYVLLIRVSRSYMSPHRVVFKNKNRFWARSCAGKYEPDVNELRALFSVAPHLAARVREMRTDRIVQVLAGDTPVLLQERPGLSILHIIPIASADARVSHINMELLSANGGWVPVGATGCTSRRNLDGWVVYSGEDGTKTRSYIQVFRSGMIEVVKVGNVVGDPARKFVWVENIAKWLFRQVFNILSELQKTQNEPPYIVQLSISGMQDVTFEFENPDGTMQMHEPIPQKRDVITFIESLIDESAATADQVVKALTPTLDQIFQTVGRHKTPLQLMDYFRKARQ